MVVDIHDLDVIADPWWHASAVTVDPSGRCDWALLLVQVRDIAIWRCGLHHR